MCIFIDLIDMYKLYCESVMIVGSLEMFVLN